MPMEPSFETVSRSGARHTLALKLVGVAAGVAIAVAAIALIVSPTAVLGPWSTYGLPDELRSAGLVVREGERAAVYVPGMLWYERVSEQGMPGDFVRTDGSTLSVSREGGKYVLRENGEVRVSSDAALAAPSQAPYTKAIAYAVRFHGHGESTKIPAHVSIANPGEWEVHLYLPQTGTSQKVVSGYAPLFIDDTRFFFFTSRGVYRYDLTTGTAEQVLARSFPILITPVLQSPDRTMLAVRDAANTTSIYQVNDGELVLARTIDEMLATLALTNKAFYDVRGTGNGTEVWRYGLTGEPALVHTFPSALPITRLVF